MSKKQPFVPLSRALLLLKDGEIKRAAYNLHFAKYFTNKDNRDNVFMFLKMIAEMTELPDEYVSRGVKCYDKGDYEKAVEYYSKALELYPKSPEALYEIGLMKMTSDLGVKAPKKGVIGVRSKSENSKIELHSGLPYYEMTRLHDPFFTYAYQGNKDLIGQMTVIMRVIDPLLPSLYKSSIKADSMAVLGDAFVKINQYEYAIYAYMIAFYGSFKEKYDKKLLDKITSSLNALNAKETSKFFEGEIHKLDKIK
jgi:tetratricopeptide (TPR) repeat protein